MPYITKTARVALDLGSRKAKTPGELNYLITKLVREYIENHLVTTVTYTNLNEVIGVLECTKQELYRRVLAPYEEIKREENGDVYPEGRTK